MSHDFWAENRYKNRRFSASRKKRATRVPRGFGTQFSSKIGFQFKKLRSNFSQTGLSCGREITSSYATSPDLGDMHQQANLAENLASHSSPKRDWYRFPSEKRRHQTRPLLIFIFSFYFINYFISLVNFKGYIILRSNVLRSEWYFCAPQK